MALTIELVHGLKQRAINAKNELSEYLGSISFDNPEEIREYVIGLTLSDDAVIVLRAGYFTQDWWNPEDHSEGKTWVFYMPSTVNAKNALLEWESKGRPKRGRKLHIRERA